MNLENSVLKMTEEEFIEIINGNPDKSDDNTRINGILISIIKKNRNALTIKQKKWIMDKLNYIFRRKKEYKITRFDDFEIEI